MKSKRVSRKIVLGVIAFLVVIAMIIYLGYINHKDFENIIVSQTQQQLLMNTRSIAIGIEEFIVEHSDALSTISRNPIIQGKAHKSILVKKPPAKHCLYLDVYESHKDDMDSFSILDARGIMLCRVPHIEERFGRDHTDKPGVAYVIKEHKPHISELFYNNFGNPVVSILEPIFYKDKFAGIVRSMIETDTIVERFVKPIKIGSKGFVWAFDNRNIVISHPRKDFIGMTVLDVIRKMHKEVGEFFDESRVQEHIREKHDYLNRVKVKEEGVGIFINYATDENDIIAFKRVQIGNATFNLIITLPYSEIVGPINDNARNSAVLFGLFFLLYLSTGTALFIVERKREILETDAKHLKQIAESAAELNQIFNTAADGMRVVDKDFNTLRVNETFSTLSGISKEEAFGKKCYEVFPGPMCHNSICPLTRILGGEERVEYEVEKERKDGTRIPCIVTATPFREPDGKLIGIIEDYKDITERKQAEIDLKQFSEALQKSEESFQAIVNKNPGGIIVVNREGFVKFVNPTAELLFEKKAEELIDNLFGVPIADEKIELDIILSGGKAGVAEMCVVETIWLGKPAFFASLFDVTAIKKAEEALINVNKELVKLDEMKTEFISIASHELRTPLTSIKNSVDLILRKKAGEINENQKKFLSMAERNINRLGRLLDDLLSISKIESGKILLDYSEIDIRTVMENVVQTFGSLVDEKSISLDTRIAPDLPRLYVDVSQIEQVLINLISNAIKFTPDQGKITIDARLGEGDLLDAIEKTGQYVMISVTDTGCGIAEEFQKEVFNKFYQVESPLSAIKQPGTGLGLAISKGIVELHGGIIALKSTPGSGSTFSFSLPIATGKTPLF